MRIECNGDRVSMSKNEYRQVMNKQNDYKQQRDELSEKLDKECNDNYKLEGQLYDMTKQRDSLIKDVEKLRKELKDLEGDYGMVNGNCMYWKDKLDWLNEQYDKLLNKYTDLTEHIRLKEENNPSEWRYKSLVGYINELERDTDGG
ncbi:hypothetical protein [Mammaliicoccus lentus]|uniref:hypothetical protein n=1 Tax=Mammaliicoccus lentus TaxID=42858 RepID=UPI00264A20F8|nr:hypothetical protein [Mammaliicoccus lentus]